MADTELERILVRIVADNAQFLRSLESSMSGVTDLGRHFEATVLQMVGLGSLFEGIKGAFSLAAEAETNQVAFEVMLRDAKAAAKMMEDIQKLAAETPFETDSLVRAAKTLLQFGVEGKQVLPILRMLGDVTGGDAEKLKLMSIALGQTISAGRLMGMEVLQMVNAGFNPLQIMAEKAAKTLGTDVPTQMKKLKKEMEAGNISIRQVIEAFQDATSAGGRFEGHMEKQSKTLKGLFSTLRDDIAAILRTLGKDIIEGLRIKEVIQLASAMAQRITAMLQSLTPEFKRTATILGAFGFASAGALATWSILGPAIIRVLTGMVAPLGTMTKALAGLPSLFTILAGSVMLVGTSLKGVTLTLISMLNPLKAISLMFFGIWKVVQPIGMAIGVLLGPIGLMVAGLAAVAAGTAAWVREVGGLSVAWEMVKTAAIAAWDWLQPIRQALVSFFMTVWQTGVSLFQRFGDFVLGIWKSITGSAIVNWETIRTAIVDAILFAEFTIMNFGAVMKHIWAGAVLGLVTFANQFEYFFTQVIPVAAKRFWISLKAIFIDVFNFGVTVMSNLAQSVINILKNIPDALKGQGKQWDQLWVPITQGFVRSIRELPGIPKREIGALEDFLKKEFDKQGEALGQSWEDFRRKKLLQFSAEEIIPPEEKAKIEQDSLDLGKFMGDSLGKGVKEAQKFDAALVRSSEGFSRMLAQRDKVRKTDGDMAGKGKAAPTVRDAAPVRSAEGVTRQADQQNKVLKDIHQTLVRIENKPAPEAVPLGLA